MTNQTEVKIKKLNNDATLPTYGTAYSAGADLYALCDTPIQIEAGQTVLVHTGISMQIPVGLVGLIYARSGLATKKGLAPANKVGVIDSDYRGEIMVALYNQSGKTQIVENGERIAQMVFAPYLQANFDVVENLTDTTRGEGGFGSTGSK